ncbi:hypothetical protein SAMN05216360_10271 [Methylobacterium phyllostachyos]|uniref:Uncharacterized protein n=1 Tax=Methylobacterium phyllostachyos TaxID=582672 RepID=A0A1G9T7R4_9HYPH|nr:hypothetical protein [Methylobacterium phyllostachyos]SDM43125.1 hypothetical protein SAMN05216360_10271 [Methylobacterium phyllostachyos]
MQAGPIKALKDRSTRDAVAIWLLLAATYLVFAGSVSLNEGLAMVACATLGTIWWWAVGRRGGIRFRFSRALLKPFGAALLGMPRQTVRVGVHLARAVLGQTGGGVVRERSAAEIAWATPHGGTAPAERAVGLLAASLAPDSYVLTIDRPHGTVVTHALKDAAG